MTRRASFSVSLLGATCAGALALSPAAPAAVPITARVALSSPRATSAAKPQSSSLSIDVDSCAKPSGACPQSVSLTVTGAPGVGLRTASIKRSQLCDLGSPPDASRCPARSAIGSATIGAFADPIGPISAPGTVYAAKGTGGHVIDFALFGSEAGVGLTFPGSITETGGTFVLSIPKFSVDSFGSIKPLLYKLSMSVDKVVKTAGRRRGRRVKKRAPAHLFSNPAACPAAGWLFTVTEAFQGDSGTATSAQPCSG